MSGQFQNLVKVSNYIIFLYVSAFYIRTKTASLVYRYIYIGTMNKQVICFIQKLFLFLDALLDSYAKQECLLQGQAQLDQRVIFSRKSDSRKPSSLLTIEPINHQAY